MSFKRPHKDHPFYGLIVFLDRLMVILGVIFVVAIVLGLTSCVTTTKIVCPQLAPPPASVVDALEVASGKDPNAASWTIGLDRQYQKQELCRP